ncbi:MAG: hypothetical protein HSCHL_0707 [Hydrogenibacillus schlegelii]|uniref:Uncharacterized protein n=1 Tax=Hydrogenibacillus schlegelii TaxID=1484 RepID=A0A2T5G7R4_HYDSH|nr:hypothetical protein [Hydrogenibacillus schlegelii]PTQ52236.1 MAG: hypothetical protein HSCHL_0707 [Hydrogenibacillus schlegelii]
MTALYVHLLTLPARARKIREDRGGETLQNVVWILVGLAIALLVGWVFFKDQIYGFAGSVWKNLASWSSGELNSNTISNQKTPPNWTP